MNDITPKELEIAEGIFSSMHLALEGTSWAHLLKKNPTVELDAVHSSQVKHDVSTDEEIENSLDDDFENQLTMH